MNIQTSKTMITITRMVDGTMNRAQILTHRYDINGVETLKSRAELERDLKAPDILSEEQILQIADSVLADQQG